MANIDLPAARFRAIHERPYFAAALLALIPVPRHGFGTCAVDDRWRLYYDPEMFDKWGVEKSSGVIVHEISHLLRRHGERCQEMSAEYRAWNIAADLEINDDVGLPLPEEGVSAERFNFPKNQLVEEYYHLLMKNAVKIKVKISGGSGGGSGGNDDKGDGGNSGSGDHKKGKGKGSGDMEITITKYPMPGTGNCGSCATGKREDWEEGSGGKGKKDGKDKDGKGDNADGLYEITKAEADLIRRAVAREILEASKIRGTIPGGWERWANKELEPPKVNWRRVLASTVRWATAWAAGQVDYTFSKISRRSPPGIFLPSLRAPVPKISVVIDTSGSVSDDMLLTAVSELYGVLRTIHGDIKVLPCDAAVGTVKKVSTKGDLKRISLGGGGGTDMCVGIDRAMLDKPNVLIILTDCETPWPETAPNAQVIIGRLGSGDFPKWRHKAIDIKDFEKE